MIVERLANAYSHSCEILIPPSHYRAGCIQPIPRDRLDAVRWRVENARKTLGKHITNPHTLDLICRNAVLVEEASQLLTLGWFNENGTNVMGGTGWGVEMVKAWGIPTFVYNLKYREWWQWRADKQSWYQGEGMSEDITEPPLLYDKTVIVGTRQINSLIDPELRQLFHIYDNPPNLF